MFSLLLVPLLPRPAAAPVSDDALNRVRPAVVTVLAGKTQGTGFVVRPDGTLLTAWHVVAGSPAVTIKFPGGRRCVVGGVLAMSAERDFALLRLAPGQTHGTLATVALAPAGAARKGEAIAIVGTPLGREQTATRGAVLDVRAEDGRAAELQVSGEVRPGDSGAPIVNARGEAIGIVTHQVGGMDDLNYGLALDAIRDALRRAEAPGAPAKALAEASAAYPGSAEEQFARASELLRALHDACGPGGLRLARAADRPKYEQALALLNEALAKRRAYPMALVNAGLCALRLGRPAEALGRFEAALRLRPGDVFADGLRATALARAGRTADALSAVRAILARAPEFAPARVLLGDLLLSRGRSDPAIEAYRAALRLQPGYADAHLHLGLAYGARGQTDEEIVEIGRAVALRPSDAEAVRQLGAAYARAGEHTRAVVALGRAMRLDPADPQAHALLGVEYVALGDTVRARRELAALEKLDGGLAAKLRARIAAVPSGR